MRSFFCAALRAACEDDAVARVVLEKLEPLGDPGVEPRCHVARNLQDDVPPILEPAQFGLRRRGPDRFFTFLALISESHRS